MQIGISSKTGIWNKILERFNAASKSLQKVKWNIDGPKIDVFLSSTGETNFNILHINCRSLNKNFNEVKNFISTVSNRLNVIALSETWLNESTASLFNIHGYNFVSKH